MKGSGIGKVGDTELRGPPRTYDCLHGGGAKSFLFGNTWWENE